MQRIKTKKNNALPAIKEILRDANVPHDGYRMRNKLHKRHGMDFDGADIQRWMSELADRGEIQRAELSPSDEYETFCSARTA